MTHVLSRLVLAAVLLSFSTAPLLAAPRDSAHSEQSTITVRTGEHPRFDRVVFDAPKGTTYKITKQGNLVTVSFSLAGHVQMSSDILPRAPSMEVVRGKDGNENLAVRFVVAPDAVLKDFYSESSIVVDVTGPAVAMPVEKKEAQIKEKQKAEKTEEISVETNVKVEAAAQKPPEAPVPTKHEPLNIKTEEKITKEAKLEGSNPTSPLANKNEAPVPMNAPVAQVEIKEVPPEKKPVPSQLLIPTIEKNLKAIEQIHKILDETPPEPIVILDPKMPIGAAIFVRGGYITILFDRKLVGESLITSPAPRVELEPLELPHNTGFRIAVPDRVGVQATRKGTAWEIFLTRAGVDAKFSTEFIVQPDFALGGRLLVSTGNPPTPIFFPDPVVGDDLIILPLRETGAFTLKRRLADFSVIPAAQGLAIKPLHDKVMARIVPDGIEITSEGGLKLSPSRDTGRYIDQRYKSGKHLYSIERWRGQSDETFTQTREKLMQTITQVPEEERVLARLDLARFYFAHGLAREALSILDLTAKRLPEIGIHPDFLAVLGGARILAGYYSEGMEDLNHPSLRDQPEAVLWKAVASAGSQDWVSAFEQFNSVQNLLENYPEPFRSRFTVLSIESAAATGKDQKAAEWLDRIEQGGHESSAASALRYLRGVIYSKGGRADMAEKLWRVVTKGDDRLYKIRAEMALIDLGVATHSLSPKQAVEKLEGLRFAWRGDDLELDILTRLGGFYIDAKNFRKGFTVLSRALRLFPNAPPTPALRAQMVSSFHDVFMTDLGADLSPLEALSLYTDFNMLIPAGEKGNGVRSNLAERLIDIDLLDPAAKLLEDLLKNSSDASSRVQTATRLAAVRLLDHKSKEALGYLERSDAEAQTLSQAVRDERQLLRVRALSELGKYREAMEALPNNHENATMLLRADISMRAKNWQDAVQALMELVGPPPASGKSLTEEQAGWLVNAAVSMAKNGDVAGLDRLAIDYGKAVDKSSKGNLFHVLTQPESLTQMKDIRAAQSKLSEVDMFRGILDGYRTKPKTQEKKTSP